MSLPSKRPTIVFAASPAVQAIRSPPTWYLPRKKRVRPSAGQPSKALPPKCLPTYAIPSAYEIGRHVRVPSGVSSGINAASQEPLQRSGRPSSGEASAGRREGERGGGAAGGDEQPAHRPKR